MFLLPLPADLEVPYGASRSIPDCEFPGLHRCAQALSGWAQRRLHWSTKRHGIAAEGTDVGARTGNCDGLIVCEDTDPNQFAGGAGENWGGRVLSR